MRTLNDSKRDEKRQKIKKKRKDHLKELQRNRFLQSLTHSHKNVHFSSTVAGFFSRKRRREKRRNFFGLSSVYLLRSVKLGKCTIFRCAFFSSVPSSSFSFSVSVFRHLFSRFCVHQLRHRDDVNGLIVHFSRKSILFGDRNTQNMVCLYCKRADCQHLSLDMVQQNEKKNIPFLSGQRNNDNN